MSRGWDRVEQEHAEQQARKEAFDAKGGGHALYSSHIKQAPGQEITVRFLEQGQEVNVFDQHQYKVPDVNARGGSRLKRFTCFKEIGVNDCPGCIAGLPIKPRTVFNLIQRGRPILRKDNEGKALKDQSGNYLVEGYADDVVYWEVANTTANMIRKCDNEFRGLMSRDLKIGISGDNFQPYTLMPVDIDSGTQPMSETDMALAAKKHDLDKIYAPPTVQEAASIVARYGANSGATSTQGQMPVALGQQVAPNPMMAGVTVPAGSPFAAAQNQPQTTQQ